MALYAGLYRNHERHMHQVESSRPRYTSTFTKVRSNYIDLGGLCTDHADTSLLVPVDSTKPWAEVAILEVRVCRRALFRGLNGR